MKKIREWEVGWSGREFNEQEGGKIEKRTERKSLVMHAWIWMINIVYECMHMDDREGETERGRQTDREIER